MDAVVEWSRNGVETYRVGSAVKLVGLAKCIHIRGDSVYALLFSAVSCVYHC